MQLWEVIIDFLPSLKGLVLSLEWNRGKYMPKEFYFSDTMQLLESKPPLPMPPKCQNENILLI